MRKIFLSLLFLAQLPTAIFAGSVLDSFTIKPFSANDFYTFIKVFSEMRGPLRTEILKDKKTNFENVDPLKYVEKIKDKKDVKAALKKSNITWDQFAGLFGNVLLAYLSTEPQQTKAAIIRQLADYGLIANVEGIPEEYKEVISSVIKTPEGSNLAATILEQLIEIPEQNIATTNKNRSDLDRMFYTKHWVEDLGRAP